MANFFHHINSLHQNFKFTMEEESNGELAFLDTTALTTKQVARKVLFPPCLIGHTPLSQITVTYTKKTLE